MSNIIPDGMSDRRRKLENPYAFLPELERLAALRAERRRYENPYAFIEELIEQTPAPLLAAPKKSKTMRLEAAPRQADERWTEKEIEALAFSVHRALWNDAKQAAGPKKPEPLSLLKPAAALALIGFECETLDSLGEFHIDGVHSKVAGILDRESNRAQICGQFPLSVRNFTAAHELGHALMHQGTGLHRDRALDGSAISREPQEYEADRFATVFLMPERLLKSVFESMFLLVPFRIREDTWFALQGASPMRRMSQREISLKLANATTFNRKQLVPLRELFCVSRTAMAIRLEELQLIDSLFE